jgi:hypothetical protein
MGSAQGAQQRLRGTFVDVTPTRHNYHIGPLQGTQRWQGRQGKARARSHGCRVNAAHDKIKGLVWFQALAEHHAGHGQMKWADAFEDHDCHAATQRWPGDGCGQWHRENRSKSKLARSYR